MTETLRGRLETDLRAAMRAGDTVGRDVIRYLLAAVKNAEIDKGGPLAPVDEAAVLRRQAKQRQESIEQFRAGKRDDLAEREEAQLAILSRYLPAELSDDELRSLAEAVVREVGASGPKDMGKVMPAVIARAEGRADGRRVSAVVRAVLAGA
jgi:uncharacterized protein